MPMPSSKRALIAIAVLVGVASIGGGFYLYRLHRPLAASSAGATPNILSLLPADAPAVAYMDVAALRKLQNSPLAAMLGLAGENPQTDRDYQNFVTGTGFDYTRDLDRAALAIWPATGAANSPTVAIADGRFDQSKIKAYALRTGKIVTRGTQLIYEVPGDPPVAFQFLSATRIELASGTGAETLLSAAKSTPRDPAMQERIDRVAGAPIFAVARTDNLPPAFYDNLKNSPQFESLARSVRGLTFAGQPDAAVIHVTLDAECDSMTNAIGLAALVDTLRLLGSMAMSDPKSRSQMTKEQAAFLAALLAQVKVTHQDKWVRLTLDVTRQMLGPDNSNHADLR
jgi:hypothetical protein